jgi:hypothetical protein
MCGSWYCGEVERYVPGSSRSGLIPVTASNEHYNDPYDYFARGNLCVCIYIYIYIYIYIHAHTHMGLC